MRASGPVIASAVTITRGSDRGFPGAAVVRSGRGLPASGAEAGTDADRRKRKAPASGRVTTIWTAADWAAYGKVMNGLMADPELNELMATSMGPDGPTLGFETYVSQTIPDL